MIPGSANPLLLKSAAAAAGGYQVQRSLRFNSSDSAFCSRTPAVAGNRRTFTFSTWVKRSKLSSGFQQLICSYDGSTGSTYFSIIFTPSDTIRVEDISVIYRETTQVFRDASAWYCIQLAVDTTQATAANRIKLYVNGSEVTTFATTNNPTQNTDFGINNTVAHAIGRSGAQSAYYLDGYLAECYLIDGQQLTSSSFTEVSATTGQLIPKAYTGTFGTNGFWLKFSDNSAATAATLGKDYSGNSNNWTPNNLSVTAGAGNDSLVDTPTSFGTDTSVGGEVRGNYATLNPLDVRAAAGVFSALSNGNMQFNGLAPGGGASGSIVSTIGISTGKWYSEFTISATSGGNSQIGIVAPSSIYYPGYSANSYSYAQSGQKTNNDISTSYGSSYTTGDVVGVALDLGGGTITFYKNGSSQGQAFSGLSGTYFFAVGKDSSAATNEIQCNFGQRAFAYTAPSGFKALCDTNLPAPLTAKPNTVMDVALYNGNGAANTITGLAFSPDLVWMKVRSTAYNHTLIDSVRGATKTLSSSMTVQEYTEPTGPTAFTADGWSMSGDVTYVGSVNASGQTYVAWAWDAGTSTVSNTAGSITSQVRANPTAGFSVVTYTGNRTAGATVGHGLGVAPQLIFVKSRAISGFGWRTYHASVGNTKYLTLNSTDAAITFSGDWNNTTPSSSVVTLGADGGSGNYSTNDTTTYVAYCFAPVVGYGNGLSYVGNGSADGPFVYLGFRPKLILIKCSSTTGNWVLLDAEREGYNVDNDPLFPNLSDAEGTTDLLDITSNGFKIRSTNADVNASAATYIVYAWASNPFQYSRAR